MITPQPSSPDAGPDAEILVARSADRDALRRRLRRGSVRQVRRGAYVDGSPSPDAAVTAHVRALERIAAVDQQIRGHAFARESALLVWGIRTWTVPTDVHVIQGYRASAAAARDIVRHFVPLSESDVVERGGLPVTTLERTLLDVARFEHPLRALVALDHALARGVPRPALLQAADGLGSVRGAARARHVIALADAGAESHWETWLRYVALRAGLPRPQTQVEVSTRLGVFRSDLGWPDHGVLAEFDGQVKYADGVLRPDHSGAQALFEEKRRTDAIHEATGILPVRATARDHPAAVRTRLLSKFPRTVATEARTDRLLPPPASASS